MLDSSGRITQTVSQKDTSDGQYFWVRLPVFSSAPEIHKIAKKQNGKIRSKVEYSETRCSVFSLSPSYRFQLEPMWDVRTLGGWGRDGHLKDNNIKKNQPVFRLPVIFVSEGFRSRTPLSSHLADWTDCCNSRGSPSSGFHKPSLQRWHHFWQMGAFNRFVFR